MSDQEEQERYRYLQLKMKMGSQEQGPSMIQRGAQMATIPFRGFRGLAVGAENLMAHPTEPNAALQRASEATKTGFRPHGIMETGASMLGESVPMMPLGGALGEGGKMAQIIKAALAGGGVSALNQTAEEGRPTVGQTALSAGLSMAPTAAEQALKGVFPVVAGKFTKVPAAAYQGLTSAFKKTFPGTSDAISGVTGRVAPALEGAFDAVSKRINARRKFMGMEMLPKEAMQEMEATGGEPRNLGRIAKEFKQMQRRSAPKIETKVDSQLINPKTNKPFQRTVTERGIPKSEKLRKLDDFSMDINKITEGHYPSDVLQSKQAIEREATKTGGTSFKILQKFKRQWGDLKNIEDRMGTKLSDPNTAGRDLENIVRKSIENPAKMGGSDIDKLNAIGELEKLTGKQILEPLRNQIKSSYTNQGLSDYVPKGMLGKILLMKYFPEGIVSFFTGSPSVMGKVAQGLNNPAGPVAKAVRGAVPSFVGQALKRKREDPNPQ